MCDHGHWTPDPVFWVTVAAGLLALSYVFGWISKGDNNRRDH